MRRLDILNPTVRLHPPVLLTLVLAALSAAACGARQPPPSTSPAAAAPQVARQATFRAMTFNIHHGEGVDGRIDLDRIARVIREQHADLVALQEVDKGVERTSRRDLPAELEALTGLRCLFRSNFPYQGGEYGNAVLSRFPVKRWVNTPLRMLRAGEQRGVMQVVVDVSGRELLFLATHVDYRKDDEERLQNVAQFREVLSAYEGVPAIFGGDFNDTPGSRTYTAMRDLFDDAWVGAGEGNGFTIPSRMPAKRIDYLWVRKGSGLRAVRAWVSHSDASDHLPLTVEFAWER